VDRTTLYAKDFRIVGHSLIYEGKDGNTEQIMLGVVGNRHQPLRFRVKVNNTRKGYIVVGVVDRAMQREELYSYHSKHVVCYYGNGRDGAQLRYGEGGQNKYKETGVRLDKGTEVKVKVDLAEGVACFTVQEHDGKRHEFKQSSDILS
jgi:hypothetical protein